MENDPEALAGLEPPEQLPVIAICAVGKTSAIAARHLRDRGIEALTLAGGMRAWGLAWNTADVPISDPEVEVVQVRRTGKGCLSYIVGSAGEAVVIDASVDPQVYIRVAAERNWKIVATLDTHVHADHLSRSKPLSESGDGKLYFPAQDRVSFHFSPLGDSDAIEFGRAKLSVIRTPGHTEESNCYQLNDRVLFTGDTLFLDSVGRPDLAADGEETGRRARLLHQSLLGLRNMSPDTIILPGHTGKPVAFDKKPLFKNLAAVIADVEVFSMTEDEFVHGVVQRMPPTPRNHLRIIQLNEAGVIPRAEQADLEAGANRCSIS